MDRQTDGWTDEGHFYNTPSASRQGINNKTSYSRPVGLFWRLMLTVNTNKVMLSWSVYLTTLFLEARQVL